MAQTSSIMLTLGVIAADFQLPNVINNQTVSLKNFAQKKALLVIFLSRHCPFVQHIQNELYQLGEDYQSSDLGIVAISANDANGYPDDAPESLKEFAQALFLKFPVLYDKTQQTAKDYFAACTPDFFLFDRARRLVYRGQLDDSRPKNGIPVTGKDLRAAISAVLYDREVSFNQQPSIGCNIKWKSGNAPKYYRVAAAVG